jgi:GNAT superfamily N-acetyltransferase
VTARYRAPELLRADHVLDSFTCRSSEQTQWLRRFARQSIAASSTRVFVVTELADQHVVAYYGWCMAQLAVEAAPSRLRRGAGHYPQPVALLARLGVDTNHEGRGLGAALLADVVRRLVALDDAIGCRGLLIHAEGEDARNFYLHLIPELELSPTDPLHLVLLMKDARRSLREGRE